MCTLHTHYNGSSVRQGPPLDIPISLTAMRALSVSLITALQALAIILPQSHLSIPLTKRSVLRTTDGHVDPASIRAYIHNTEA